MLINHHQTSPHQLHHQPSQDSPKTPTSRNNPQPSTRISFQGNPYTFEERHAQLSEPLEPVNCQATLSEPTYNLYPTLQQDLNRVRHISQNQNTSEIHRQIIHPRRNRNFQTPRVHFNIPQSPTTTTSELLGSTLPETPTLFSQHSTSNIPSDYLGSTPTSQQIRETPFNPQTPPNDHHIGQHTHILNKTPYTPRFILHNSIYPIYSTTLIYSTIGHSVGYNIDRIFTKIFKNTTFKYFNKIVSN